MASRKVLLSLLPTSVRSVSKPLSSISPSSRLYAKGYQRKMNGTKELDPGRRASETGFPTTERGTENPHSDRWRKLRKLSEEYSDEVKASCAELDKIMKMGFTAVCVTGVLVSSFMGYILRPVFNSEK